MVVLVPVDWSHVRAPHVRKFTCHISSWQVSFDDTCLNSSFDDTYRVTHLTCVIECLSVTHVDTSQVFFTDSWRESFDDTFGVTHLTRIIECLSITHVNSLHVSFEWHVSIPHVCLSNHPLLSSDNHMSLEIIVDLPFGFPIHNIISLSITCHKLHLWQAHVTKTCVTHVLDNRLARDIVVTRQSTGTNRPSALINSVT